MRLLLDTHALIWWFLDSPYLSPPARKAIGTDIGPIFVSAVSAFEISNKVRLGKLDQAASLDEAFEDFVVNQKFVPLSIGVKVARMAGALPIPHRDPFDRLLIAHALVDDLVLISNEVVFDQFGVQRLW